MREKSITSCILFVLIVFLQLSSMQMVSATVLEAQYGRVTVSALAPLSVEKLQKRIRRIQKRVRRLISDGVPLSSLFLQKKLRKLERLSTIYEEKSQYLGKNKCTPSIDTITPNKGPQSGGTVVSIQGCLRENVRVVKFGSAQAPQISRMGPEEIIVTAPPGTKGAVNISLYGRRGKLIVMKESGFTYEESSTPSPSPSPSMSMSPSPSPSASVSPSSSPSMSASPSPSMSASPSASPTLSVSPSPSPSVSASPQPSASPTPTTTPNGDAITAKISTRLSGGTRCVAPCVVTADGSLSTHTDSAIDSFWHLNYLWDFGDPWKSGEPGEATWANSGISRNTPPGVMQPKVYDKPGTYTIRLLVTDKAGNAAIATKQITVLDPANVYVTRCVSASGSYTGCPSGASRVTSTKLSDQIAWLNGDTNRELLFEAGGKWDTGTGQVVERGKATGGHIGTYGSANNKQATFVSSQAGSVMLQINADGFTLSNITLIGGSSYASADTLPFAGVNLAHEIKDFLSLRNVIRYTANALGNPLDPYTKNINVVDTIASEIADGAYFLSADGLTVAGCTGGPTGDSHVTRILKAFDLAFVHNAMFDPSVYSGTERHNLKFHGSYDKYLPTNDPRNNLSRKAYIAFNLSGGSRNSMVVGPQDTLTTTNERVEDVLIENNHFIGPDGASLLLGAQHALVRNNLFTDLRLSEPKGPYAYQFAIVLKEYPGSPANQDIQIVGNTLSRTNDWGSIYSTSYFLKVEGSRAKKIEFLNNLSSAQYSTSGASMFHFSDTSWLSELTAHHNMANTPSSEWVYIEKTDPKTVFTYSLSEWQKSGFGSGSKAVASVGLNSPFIGDVTLSSTSPAIDAGVDLPELLDDVLGTIRPQGKSADIGAVERAQ